MNETASKRAGKLLIGASGAISILNLHAWIAYLKTAVFEEVRVIMTESAGRFVNPQVISAHTGHPTYTSELSSADFPAPHVSLTEWADVMLVLPASANTIGKAANGIADDLLSSSILAAACPVVFVPSMNMQMWGKPAVQRNIRQLQEDGHTVIASKLEQNYRLSTGTYEEGISVDIVKVGIQTMRVMRGARREGVR